MNFRESRTKCEAAMQQPARRYLKLTLSLTAGLTGIHWPDRSARTGHIRRPISQFSALAGRFKHTKCPRGRPLNGAADPPSSQISTCGPWSERNSARVLCSMCSSLTTSSTCPTAHDISFTWSPYTPIHTAVTDHTSPSFTSSVPPWRLGVVASVVRRMNEVTVHWARLLLGWVTVFGRVHHHGV